MTVVEFQLRHKCISTSVSERESSARSASKEDSNHPNYTTCKPVTSLTGNNNALARYEQSRGYNQISHALSNIHGLYGCSCSLLDVISVYSLNLGKWPGRFSYKRPGYKAKLIANSLKDNSLIENLKTVAIARQLCC